ncbi:MAG: glycosyltransferase family A protein [Chitinophagales bacterium]
MSMPKPDHTFAILAYKESKYLEQCIQSVLNQTVSSKVLIATSTPNAHIQSLAEKYKIPVHINPNGGSIGKDWNFGFHCADTTCVTITHQDDIYLSTFAEDTLNAIRVHAEAKPLMVFNKSIVYKGDHEMGFSFKNVIRWLLIFPFHFKRCISSIAVKKSILYFSNSISCPGVCYVKDNLAGFSFNEEEKYILDWRAWYDMAIRKGAFIYLDKVLHIHREHEESATSSTHLQVLQKEEQALLTEIWGNTFMPKIITRLLTLAK